MRKTGIYLIGLCLPFTACDSGDIYPEKELDVGKQVEISWHFENTDAFPRSEYYQMVFASFQEGGEYPLSYKNIADESDESLVLSNIPDDADLVSVSLLDKGRKLIYHFFTYPLTGTGDEELVKIPLQTIALADYGRVQEQLFTAKCIACHGGSNFTAANLNLTADNSFDNLVGVQAQCSSQNRVTSGNASKSFILDVLLDRELLSTDHTEMVKDDDINLLRAWVNNGCHK